MPARPQFPEPFVAGPAAVTIVTMASAGASERERPQPPLRLQPVAADARGAFVARHQRGLWRFARLLGAANDHADDLVQEALLAALHKRIDARPEPEAAAWLRAAVRNLWRMHLRRFDLDGRFAALAERWAERAEDAFCAFNDLHAMMAFAGAGRWDLASRLLRAQQRRIARLRGANRDMTRLVGYPASRAIAAFGRGDYSTADALLRSLPPVAHRIGIQFGERATHAAAGVVNHDIGITEIVSERIEQAIHVLRNARIARVSPAVDLRDETLQLFGIPRGQSDLHAFFCKKPRE